MLNPFAKNARRPEDETSGERRDPAIDSPWNDVEEAKPAAPEGFVEVNEPALGEPTTPAAGAALEPAFGEPALESTVNVEPTPEYDAPFAPEVEAKSEPEPTPAAAPKAEPSAAAKRLADPVEAREPIVTEPVPRVSVEREQAAERQKRRREERRIPTHEEVLEQKRMRYRLIGAAAILLALVIVLPFVLDKESSVEEARMNLDIPEPAAVTVPVTPAAGTKQSVPADDGVAVAVAGDPAKAQSAGKANLQSEAAAASKPVAKPEAKPDAKPDTKPAAKTDAKTDAKADAKPEAKPDAKAEAKTEAKPDRRIPSAGLPAPTGPGFYIQVLATRSELAAEKLVKDLAILGLPAYKLPSETQGKTMWRVRVGLYKTKEDAQSAMGILMLNGVSNKVFIAKQ